MSAGRLFLLSAIFFIAASWFKGGVEGALVTAGLFAFIGAFVRFCQEVKW